MSKYRHVAVTLSPAAGQETRLMMRVESSMHLLSVVLDRFVKWHDRTLGSTVFPTGHSGGGMALHVFGEGSKFAFSVHVTEIEPEYLTEEFKRMKPTAKWATWKVVDEAFRSFESDLAAAAVPEAA